MAETPGGVLVIAAHPDDEVLGCGGTVALHAARGDRVWAVLACEGESARGGDRDHAAQTEAARKVLGIERVIALDFPDQRLDTLPLVEVVRPLEEAVAALQPRVVYCQHGGDVNRDHQLLFQATLVATRPTVPGLEAVYAFDTASSTEWGYPRSFVPDTWVDIGAVLPRKLEAMACYHSELCAYPHPRSLEALRHKAHAWGNQACMDAAEVFMTIRRQVRDGRLPH